MREERGEMIEKREERRKKREERECTPLFANIFILSLV